MIAYRYLERRYALEAVEEGKLRLASTISVAALESGLADPLDSGILRKDTYRHIAGPLTDEERGQARRMDINIEPGCSNINMGGNRHTSQIAALILCCTDIPNNDHLFRSSPQNDTVLRIADLDELVRRLTLMDERLYAISQEACQGDRLRVLVGEVRYAPREGDERTEFEAHPFIKAKRFENERELRGCWAPTIPATTPMDVTVPEIRELLSIV